MTLAQIKSLIRMSNLFRNRSSGEFLLDLVSHGITPAEIDPCQDAEPDGSRSWPTAHGCLVERDGKLSLEPIEAGR